MRFPSSGRSIGYSILQQHLDKNCKDNFSVLEAGCGSGLISLELAMKKKLRELVLLDLSPEFIIRENFSKFNLLSNNINYIVGDIHRFPFRDQSFDLVFNEGVIEHLDDMEKGVKEIARVSKEIVLIFIPNYYNILWRIDKRIKRWSGKFYHGADEYGLEKDLTHKIVKKWLTESGYMVKLLEIGGLKRDIPFPKALKTSIGILGRRI